MNFKGSRTEKNLLAAFAGESQARNRYTYFAAQQRRKDLNRSARSFLRPQIMKRNMPSYSSNTSRAGMLK